MAGFSSEEILDLLYKKVAFGANKSGRSEQFTPAGETSSSFIAVKPSSIWREATTTNVPVVPPNTTSSYVQVYASHTGAQPSSTTAVALCTPNGDAPAMPDQTLFKRSWKTGATNWLGPTFGAGYLVKVYVGPTGWDGDTTDASITQVIFGSDANRDWYFDYESGMLYWTPENENGSGSFEDSDTWTTFTDTHVVYIAGYRYIGATGAGGTSDITGGASTIATADLTDDRALISNGSGKVAVSTVTSAELAYVSGVTSAIQTQLNNIQSDVDGNETDADAAIAAVASDLSSYETSNDSALAALQSDVDQNESDADTAIALKLALAGGTMTGNITMNAGTSLSLGGHAIDDIDIASEFVDSDNHLMTSAAINDRFALINANTTGTASNVTGTVAIANGGTGVITSDIWLNSRITTNANGSLNYDATAATAVNHDSLAGFVAEEHIDWAGASAGTIDASNIPILNQNTTGSAVDLAGGALGSVPYQDGSASTAFLAGNTAATNLFMRSVGDGANAAAPTFAAVTKADVGLNLVENTALSTFTGTTNIATVGTITTGTWGGTAIGITYGGTGQSTAIAAFNALANIDHGGDFTIGTQANDTAIFTGHGSFGGDLTVAGNLNVIGSGTYINLQQENVYMKDALITLGNADDGDDADLADADALAAGTFLGIEAYKQNHDNTAHPSVVFDSTAGSKYWAIDNKDHASSALTRVARTFKVAHTISTAEIAAGFFTVTHNLNHEDLIVQVRDNSTDQEVIFFKYKTKTAQTLQIFVGSNFANGDVVNVVVVG